MIYTDKLPSDLKELSKVLIEKYHLVDNNGIIIDINEFKIKIKDFSDLRNLTLIKGYFRTRKKLSNIQKAMKENYNEIVNSHDKSINMFNEFIDLSLNIMSNVIEEENGDLIKLISIITSKQIEKVLLLIIDILICIDIAVHSGFTKFINNIHSIDKENLKDIKLQIIVTNNNNEVIPFTLPASEKATIDVLMETIRFIYKQADEGKNEFFSNYDINSIDLSKLKPIGSA